MKIDKRILDRLSETFSDEPVFLEKLLAYLNENCKEVYLGDFKVEASGFCDQNGDIFINKSLLKDGVAPRLFLPFVLLHESVHISHNWKGACELEYSEFKSKINECEDEANGFALNLLKENISDDMEFEYKEIEKIFQFTEVKQKESFDKRYKPLYESIGGSLNFREHVGEVV